MSEERDFPLFPLPLVALPGELIPLHIFEDRYKAMVEHCLEHEAEFGIVWAEGPELRRVGCACEIVEVLERLEDGRVNLVARGTRPFRLHEEQFDLPYPAGAVDFLDDEPDADPDPEVGDDAREAYAELVEQATDRRPQEQALAAMSAYDMAATVDFGLDAKQGLLDLRSEQARLGLCLRLFRAARKRLAFAQGVQALAQSNGKVRFGAPD